MTTMKKLAVATMLSLCVAALGAELSDYVGAYQQTHRDKKPATGSLQVLSDNGTLRIERNGCVSSLPLKGSEGTYCWQKGDSGKGRLNWSGGVLTIKAHFQHPATPDVQGEHRVQLTEQWKLSDDRHTLTIHTKGRITDLRTGIVIFQDFDEDYQRN